MPLAGEGGTLEFGKVPDGREPRGTNDDEAVGRGCDPTTGGRG